MKSFVVYECIQIWFVCFFVFVSFLRWMVGVCSPIYLTDEKNILNLLWTEHVLFLAIINWPIFVISLHIFFFVYGFCLVSESSSKHFSLSRTVSHAKVIATEIRMHEQFIVAYFISCRGGILKCNCTICERELWGLLHEATEVVYYEDSTEKDSVRILWNMSLAGNNKKLTPGADELIIPESQSTLRITK